MALIDFVVWCLCRKVPTDLCISMGIREFYSWWFSMRCLGVLCYGICNGGCYRKC